MDIKALKKIVSEAYAITENATAIPRFSTQFTFAEKEILIRIPIHECEQPSKTLVALISCVIDAALPHLKKKREDLQDDLIAAAHGRSLPGPELDVRGVVVSASVSGGNCAHAVTECRVLIREVASAQRN